jgi:TadE-like protein
MTNRLHFLRNDSGSTTVEFVVVFLAFIAIMFFVIEVTLYMFFLASLEKAAEAGVRTAVVSTPVVADPFRDLEVNRAGNFVRQGALCRDAQCQTFHLTCDGDCDSDRLRPILGEMKKFNARITASDVSVTYESTGIGFAGGPAVPMVTVTVSGVPFRTGILGLLLGDGADIAGVLPPRSASMTGEDLAQ